MAVAEFHLDTRIRRCHIPLTTQQHRIRHLRSISARNIPISNHDSSSKIGVYFSLHHIPDSPSFYTSEVIYECVNPSWKNFESRNFPESVNTASPYVTVKVWNTIEKAQLLIEWVVFFSGLGYLGEQVPKEGKIFKPNTLIFGMMEGYYGSVNCLQHIQADNIQVSITESMPADLTTLRMSYSLNTLSRIKTVERAIKQTQATVHRSRRNIENRLQGAEKLQQMSAQRELLRIKISMLQNELKDQRKKLQVLEEKATYNQTEINNMKADLSSRRLELDQERDKLIEMGRSLCEFRELLLKTDAQLAFRRKQLVSELASIYPVVELPDKKGYSIHGVYLPNSEKFSGHDETMISIALGYVCHMILMISQFLNVPLRYLVRFGGSRSSIIDHITVMIPDKNREFPLHSKGKDKRYFDYGVYLLNKNIAQLRHLCALTTRDLSATLPNLSTLIELRLSVNSEPYAAVHNVPSVLNLGQPIEQPKYVLDPHKSSQNGLMQDSSAVSTLNSRNNLSKEYNSEIEYLKKEMEQMLPSSLSDEKSLTLPGKFNEMSNNLSCSLDQGLNDIKVLEKSLEVTKNAGKQEPLKMTVKLKKLGQGYHHSSFPNLTANLPAIPVEIEDKFNSSIDSPRPFSAPLKMWIAGSSQTNSDEEHFHDESRAAISTEVVVDNSCFYTQATPWTVPDSGEIISLSENTSSSGQLQLEDAALGEQAISADLTLRTEQLANKSGSFQMQKINPLMVDVEQLQHS